MGLYDFTYYDLVNRNGASYGSRTAWLDGAGARGITFAQVRERVDRLACGLQKLGVAKGDRVGVLAKNSAEYFFLFGAAAALGAVMLPINWRLAAEEVEFILKDGEPKVLFVDGEYQALIEGMKNRLTTVESYRALGYEAEGLGDIASLMDNDGVFHREEVSSDDGFVIIYTAAVAGRPRGAFLSHRNVLLADFHFDFFLNINAKDVHLSFLPFFHVGGLFMATAAFHAGALNLSLNRFDASQAAEFIHEKKVSFMMVFSPVLSSILDEQSKKDMDLSSLRAVTGIDTPETIERYEKTIGGTFYSMYGQTETSCLATFGAYRERPGAAGKMLPLAEVTLVDDYDRPVPTGQVGEITVRGPMVFKGYWRLPEDTAYTFREGRHHTGDLGRFDEEGFLWYAGRKAEKELIKPGGENVYPAEVEKVILQHPAVERTVVFGVPDPKWKEGIKAVCTLKEGGTLTVEALISFVGERIARYKKPQYVEFVSEIPLLPDGSVDRAKVKALYGN